MTENRLGESYDAVPYEGGIVEGSHPERLATLGRLFGMDPAAIETCRVLEIGCATAGNLLPLAYSLPAASFVGIDVSAKQIELGRQVLEQYEIPNVELQVADVREAASWGREFDYIICHGVLTWVPPDVQEAIFATCRALLAPQGVAYISYNTLPGFHMRAAAGEMMRFHAAHFADATERIEQARALLGFLVRSTATLSETDRTLGPYHQILQREDELLGSLSPYYTAHEHLDGDVSGLYLYEFCQLAASHGLEYLGDATFSMMMPQTLPGDIAQSINDISPSQLLLEQYHDFVVNRQFRRSLVCRADVQLDRHVGLERIQSFAYRTRGRRDADGDWWVSKDGGIRARVGDPRIVRTLDVLDSNTPGAMTFSELLEAMEGTVTPEHLSAVLFSLYALNAIEFRTWTPQVSREISARPLAFEPARLSAAGGLANTPTPFHETVQLEPETRALLAQLDGRRTVAELADEFAGATELLERIRRDGLLVG